MSTQYNQTENKSIATDSQRNLNRTPQTENFTKREPKQKVFAHGKNSLIRKIITDSQKNGTPNQKKGNLNLSMIKINIKDNNFGISVQTSPRTSSKLGIRTCKKEPSNRNGEGLFKNRFKTSNKRPSSTTNKYKKSLKEFKELRSIRGELVSAIDRLDVKLDRFKK